MYKFAYWECFVCVARVVCVACIVACIVACVACVVFVACVLCGLILIMKCRRKLVRIFRRSFGHWNSMDDVQWPISF